MSILGHKTERSAKGKLNYLLSIQITFDLRDFPNIVALILQSKINQLSISRKKGVNAYVLTINNLLPHTFLRKGLSQILRQYIGQELLILIANLINGYIKAIVNKINALYKLIDWLNNRFDLDIEKKDKDISNIDSNSWLAGFIDQDGHFTLLHS